ncbi:uncharacterized protein LOC134204677 isoform X2 [Armigeres subalbatus]|uniref:uncharacterized protein LOC134204677 isoform X2 n=1 Tax=Armigeres subalbatus TaxID=124917 RepID=UPI002ED4C6D1
MTAMMMNGIQIAIGSALTMAHRSQLRCYKGQTPQPRQNVWLGVGTGGRDATVEERTGIEERNQEDTEEVNAGSGSDDEPFRGFPMVPAKARKRNATSADLPNVCLRRSKRVRKRNEDPEFSYS